MAAPNGSQAGSNPRPTRSVQWPRSRQRARFPRECNSQLGPSEQAAHFLSPAAARRQCRLLCSV
eukprot:5570545-Prymnesium_polylepis.1